MKMNREDLDNIRDTINDIERDYPKNIVIDILIRCCRDLIYVIENNDIVHE